MNKYQNFYDSLHDYVKGKTMAAWVFWLSVVILLIGINNFAEDTYSSYIGVQQIEKAFSVRPASWELTYWAMSLAFQVITMVAMFGYLSNKKDYWWALWLAIGSQVVDFSADIWYRANGIFTNPASVAVSFVLTFIFFTVGSEFAITLGLGLVARLMVEGMAQTAILFRNFIAGIGKLAQILASGNAEGKGATHSNITDAFQDVKHNSGNGGKSGNAQVFNDPNHKPSFKPNTGGGGGPNLPHVGGIDLETLRKLNDGGGTNSDGSPKSGHRGGNPFQGGHKH